MCLDSSVIVVVNVFRNGFREDIKGCVFFLKPIEHLVFQPSKEGFHDAVIIAITFSGHRLYHTMLLKLGPVCGVLVLPTLVRMQNQSLY